MNANVVEDDLLDQPVDAIVNPWNRNIIPWWILWPHGVSSAIKRRAGLQPFKELGRMGPIPLGAAVHTSAGALPFKAVIHVAGTNMPWTASEASIRDSVRNAVALAQKLGLRSPAFPLIGAGRGPDDRDVRHDREPARRDRRPLSKGRRISLQSLTARARSVYCRELLRRV